LLPSDSTSDALMVLSTPASFVSNSPEPKLKPSVSVPTRPLSPPVPANVTLRVPSYSRVTAVRPDTVNGRGVMSAVVVTCPAPGSA
jgi:hypothetical protein